MCWQAVKSVLLHSETKGNERVVMLVLADFANFESYECYPSIEKIAKLANVNRATVFRSLKKPVELGELEIRSGAKKNQSNIYRILLQKYEHNSNSVREKPNLSNRRNEEDASHFDYVNVANLQDSSRNSATQTIIENNININNNDDFSLYECSDCKSPVKSKFTHEQCITFANYLKKHDNSIRSPIALAIWMHREALSDDEIETHLRKAPPRRKPLREMIAEERRLKEFQQSQDNESKA